MGEHGDSCGARGSGAEVIDFGKAACRRRLRDEAAALIATHGSNPYSDFINRHGRRPDRIQAILFGRMIGIQVRAADGTLQPKLTKADKARATKRSRRTESHYLEQVVEFRYALASLGKIDADPKELIKYIDPLFGDVAAIRDNLTYAVQWLNRFAEEWGNEPETIGGPRPTG